jgi:hypothetical protein
LNGFGEGGGGPATSQITVPVNAAVSNVDAKILPFSVTASTRHLCPQLLHAGPAVFAIDKAKDGCHESTPLFNN